MVFRILISMDSRTSDLARIESNTTSYSRPGDSSYNVAVILLCWLLLSWTYDYSYRCHYYCPGSLLRMTWCCFLVVCNDWHHGWLGTCSIICQLSPLILLDDCDWLSGVACGSGVCSHSGIVFLHFSRLQQSMGYSSQWVTSVNGSQQSAFQEAGLYDVVAMLYGETTRACYFDLLSVSTMNNDPWLPQNRRFSLCQSLLTIRLAIAHNRPVFKNLTNCYKLPGNSIRCLFISREALFAWFRSDTDNKF